MSITFGIVTGGGADDNLHHMINSIEQQDIPEYEIIIVGPTTISRNKTRIIEFHDTKRPIWITRKKNIITTEAQYENIVYTHDYFYFHQGWLSRNIAAGHDLNKHGFGTVYETYDQLSTYLKEWTPMSHHTELNRARMWVENNAMANHSVDLLLSVLD